MIPYHVLELSNDPVPIGFNGGVPINRVETLNLQDGSRYAVAAIDLKVAPRRGGSLGNGLYQEVECEITLAVLGATRAQALENYEILAEILHDTSRWWDGQRLNPTYLTIQSQDAAPLWRCLIYQPRGIEFTAVPPEYVVADGRWVIPDVSLRFLRRGLWVSDSTTADSGAAVANPAVMRVSGLPDQLIPAPTDQKLSPTFEIDIAANDYLYVAMCSNPTTTSFPSTERMKIVPAEDYTVALPGIDGSVSVLADAPNLALGNILRLSKTLSSPSASITWDVVGIASDVREVTLFAAIRNNNTSAQWKIETSVNETGGFVPIAISTATTNPKIYNLGTFSLSRQFYQFNLDITLSTPSSPPNTLDMNYIIIVASNDDGNYIYRIAGETTIFSAGTITSPHYLTELTPNVSNIDVLGVIDAINRDGDVSLHSHSSAVDVCAFGTTANYWRIKNAAPSSAVAEFTSEITRKLAKLMPE